MTTKRNEDAERRSRCIRCDRDVESCAFCDAEDCPECLCYTDVVRAVARSLPPLHQHGG